MFHFARDSISETGSESVGARIGDFGNAPTDETLGVSCDDFLHACVHHVFVSIQHTHINAHIHIYIGMYIYIYLYKHACHACMRAYAWNYACVHKHRDVHRCTRAQHK